LKTLHWYNWYDWVFILLSTVNEATFVNAATSQSAAMKQCPTASSRCRPILYFLLFVSVTTFLLAYILYTVCVYSGFYENLCSCPATFLLHSFIQTLHVVLCEAELWEFFPRQLMIFAIADSDNTLLIRSSLVHAMPYHTLWYVNRYKHKISTQEEKHKMSPSTRYSVFSRTVYYFVLKCLITSDPFMYVRCFCANIMLFNNLCGFLRLHFNE